jgi:hypothetical protein
MPILSHLHQLFNAETCDASLLMLGWKDRLLSCPHGQSQDISPWGNHDCPSMIRSSVLAPLPCPLPPLNARYAASRT